MSKEKESKRFRAAIYCRVASANQLDQSALDVQESKLYDYANEHDYQVVCCLKEQGNGLTLNRPQLNVIKEMDQNTINRLLVTDMSRIGRNCIEVHDFTQALKAKGIEVEAINGSHCDSLGFLDNLLMPDIKKAMKRRRAKKDTTSADMVSQRKTSLSTAL